MDEERRLRADTCTLGKNVVKHNNPALHPDDWGVNITFIDNQLTSGQANAIYVDSVQSLIILSMTLSVGMDGFT